MLYSISESCATVNTSVLSPLPIVPENPNRRELSKERAKKRNDSACIMGPVILDFFQTFHHVFCPNRFWSRSYHAKFSDYELKRVRVCDLFLRKERLLSG